MNALADRTPPLSERLLTWLGAAVLRLLAATWRVRIQGLDRLEDRLTAGERVLLATWHGRILLGVIPFRRFRPLVMVSQSQDGERMSRVIERLGWRTVRGSSSREGFRALMALVRAMRQGSIGGLIVDGPRGPARRIKPGLLTLARQTDAVIVPVYLTARWRLEARSWDRMQIPLPFSRVWIRVGEPVRLPEELSESDAEALRVWLEEEFERGFARLDRDARA